MADFHSDCLPFPLGSKSVQPLGVTTHSYYQVSKQIYIKDLLDRYRAPRVDVQHAVIISYQNYNSSCSTSILMLDRGNFPEVIEQPVGSMAVLSLFQGLVSWGAPMAWAGQGRVPECPVSVAVSQTLVMVTRMLLLYCWPWGCQPGLLLCLVSQQGWFHLETPFSCLEQRL